MVRIAAGLALVVVLLVGAGSLLNKATSPKWFDLVGYECPVCHKQGRVEPDAWYFTCRHCSTTTRTSTLVRTDAHVKDGYEPEPDDPGN